MIKRQQEKIILSLVNKYPILALTGPRQSGKTTLLKSIFPKYRYISLENIDNRTFATDDPKAFLQKYDIYVIFDEVQRVPNLFSYIQTIVDESKKMGHYILTGSQNFNLLEHITQSLAGRVALLKLLPFDNTELKEDNLLENDYKKQLIKGFYPAIYDRNLNPSIYYANYIQTYIQRDISQLINIQDSYKFNNFVKLCAGRIGQLLNINNLAKDCGISQPTAKSWLSILEKSYIIFLLRPYYENFNKRIIKSPKLYFYDVGLASYLLDIRSIENITENQKGNLFENLIVANLYKQNEHQYKLLEYWYWRDSNGNEIDLLKKQGTIFDIYEIKSSTTILPKMIKGLDYFDKISNKKVKSKTLIYAGNENQNRTKFTVKSWRY
ncbi:MAG TPA: AAA family ATPase [Flavobacteriaceae bacterium]|jgi:predicted AAA+ superfamily ATPase|nr:AAA family ATPase [Flavobacteriaceae bacterium]